jgi:hypothetical protein
MKVSAVAQALIAVIVVAGVTGCAGVQPGPTAVPADALRSSSKLRLPGHGGSWMLPNAKKKDLLYISDSFPYGSNDVFVYSYPKGKLVGKLTGFNEPSGNCVDKAGNVFITNFGARARRHKPDRDTQRLRLFPFGLLDRSNYGKSCRHEPPLDEFHRGGCCNLSECKRNANELHGSQLLLL